MVRDHGHVHALEQAVIAAAGTGSRPHHRKERIPPGPEAIEAAKALRRSSTDSAALSTDDSDPVPAAAASTVIDLSTYERAARGRNTLA